VPPGQRVLSKSGAERSLTRRGRKWEPGGQKGGMDLREPGGLKKIVSGEGEKNTKGKNKRVDRPLAKGKKGKGGGRPLPGMTSTDKLKKGEKKKELILSSSVKKGETPS